MDSDEWEEENLRRKQVVSWTEVFLSSHIRVLAGVSTR